MFYGQFGEDRYISQFFDDSYKGLCIDIGAYDGISGSNTYYFEQNSWISLCIEPNPESFDNCNAIRKNTINCCVSNYDKDDVKFNIVRLHGNNTSAISSLAIDERLIESHKHLIENIETIFVKVKSLNTIFIEESIPKNIDFISIDTENTEIDVLKGIDFDKYNINFLIIENNFDEKMIEDFLIDKNFKKINRIAVNDFYVNNNYLKVKIYDLFEIIDAQYYIKKEESINNVTDIVNILAQRYILSNNNNIIVSNEYFKDSYLEFVKYLYITIKNTETNQIFNFKFTEGNILDFNFIFNELKKTIQQNLIEVSIGEIIDKYSILELKCKYISDANKLQDIKKEMNLLENYVLNIKASHFYKMLLYINEQIWLDTDIIKGLNKDPETIYKLTEIYNRIFDNNQKRFRLKNHFNIFEKSYIKEHKSYTENSCFIDILEESDIYAKIPEINYLCISYDIIYFSNTYKDIIEKWFINTNIKFIEDFNLDSDQKVSLKMYDLKSFTLNNNMKDFFDFNPIKYKSAGRLGDFLNQLSVICENYYKTGRKGELYIYNLNNDNFVFSLEYTYTDTYNTIMSLNFIKNYKIYNNEVIDIDLSMWRNHLYISIINKENWFHIYSKTYDVNWGKHQWLTSEIDLVWNNKIIINITSYRFISQNCIAKLTEVIKNNINNCIFISNEKEYYDHFSKNTGLNIEYYKPKNFEETVIIINSCKIGYFGLSSMAVIANALHKNHYLMYSVKDNCDYNLNNMKDLIPHVLDIFV